MAKRRKPSPPVLKPAYVGWTQIAGVKGYRIFWGTTSRSYSYQKDVGSNLQYKVPNLIKGKAYYFSGKSYNQAGVAGKFGNEVRYTP